jgi:hypothetical protein
VPQRSKNHHFVPQVLQRQFAAQAGHIWYSKRGEDGTFNPPQLKEIRTAFRIPNYYTVHIGDVPSDVVERQFYGEIDNYLGRILPKIISEIARGVMPTFSGAPLASLQEVVLQMAKRTPEFTRNMFDEVAIGKEVVESTIGGLKDSDGAEIRKQALAYLENPTKLKQIGRSLRVRATIGRSDLTEDALKNFSVRWAVSGSRSSFILTSLMVLRIGNGGSNGLSNPNMEMWMPVSPKIALVLVRDVGNVIPIKVLESTEHIRQVNEHGTTYSSEIASHSKQLIESLTGKKAIVR